MEKSAHTILMELAEKKGWNVYTQLKIILEYIEANDNKEDFKSHLEATNE